MKIKCIDKKQGWKRYDKQTGNPFNLKFLKDLILLDSISVYSKYLEGGSSLMVWHVVKLGFLFLKPSFSEYSWEILLTIKIRQNSYNTAVVESGQTWFSVGSWLNRIGCFYVTAILSWGYGWGLAEAELRLSRTWDGVEQDVELRLRMSWGEVEIE